MAAVWALEAHSAPRAVVVIDVHRRRVFEQGDDDADDAVLRAKWDVFVIRVGGQEDPGPLADHVNYVEKRA